MLTTSPRSALRRLLALHALALLPLSCAAVAEPPGAGPAPAWKAQQETVYLGYTGTRWASDFGIAGGSCDRAAVAAARAATAAGRRGEVATLVGGAITAVLGAEMAAAAAEADRACIAHALELLPLGRRASWSDDSGVCFEMIPENGSNSRHCRDFTLRGSGARTLQARGRACRQGDGRWELSPP